MQAAWGKMHAWIWGEYGAILGWLMFAQDGEGLVGWVVRRNQMKQVREPFSAGGLEAFGIPA